MRFVFVCLVGINVVEAFAEGEGVCWQVVGLGEGFSGERGDVVKGFGGEGRVVHGGELARSVVQRALAFVWFAVAVGLILAGGAGDGGGRTAGGVGEGVGFLSGAAVIGGLCADHIEGLRVEAIL